VAAKAHKTGGRRVKELRASFVIPAYNAQKFLSEAIMSCRNQTVKEIEIIVVDDGSTDGTRELMRWHADQDERVIPILLDKNIGRSKARNLGNSYAKSPYIFVLDADDRAAKTRVRDSLITFQMKNPDVIYGPFFWMDDLGQVIQKIPAGPFNKELALRKKMNFITHSTMAYRVGVTKNVQYDEGEYSRLGLDDWKWQWDAYRSGYKFEVVKAFLSYYRSHETNTMSTRNNDEVFKLKDEYLAQI
jgi:teichuronic acid biosynthesis glycosyltransferase TuaG